jgi:Cu(I)/Ag(I) efflux system membrane protein CusA/SilA
MVKVPGTRSAYAERVAGGYFLDFVLKRDQLARYGLSVDDANMMVMTAVGGDNQSVTVEGASATASTCGTRATIARTLEPLRRVLFPLPDGGARSRWSEIADVGLAQGPSMIRDENGLLAGYVYVDFDTSQSTSAATSTRPRRRGWQG